jgi:hypothetical protein
MTVFAAKNDSAYPKLRLSDLTVTLIPSKQKRTLQLQALAYLFYELRRQVFLKLAHAGLAKEIVCGVYAPGYLHDGL